MPSKEPTPRSEGKNAKKGDSRSPYSQRHIRLREAQLEKMAQPKSTAIVTASVKKSVKNYK